MRAANEVSSDRISAVTAISTGDTGEELPAELQMYDEHARYQLPKLKKSYWSKCQLLEVSCPLTSHLSPLAIARNAEIVGPQAPGSSHRSPSPAPCRIFQPGFTHRHARGRVSPFRDADFLASHLHTAVAAPIEPFSRDFATCCAICLPGPCSGS